MILELISAFLIIVISIVFFRSASLSMPMNLASTLSVIMIVAFLTLAAYVWKERPADERETLHSLIAGRLAYLFGVGVLVVAVVYQSFMHEIDPWLVLALCMMVLAKILLLVYSKYRL